MKRRERKGKKGRERGKARLKDEDNEKDREKGDENKLIYSSLHGVSKGKSCLPNLIEFFDRIFEWYDKGDPLDIIYLDFSKPFDKVSHKRFIKKNWRVMGFRRMS